MAQVNVTWIEGKKFIGTDSTNHSVVISSVGEGVGMKPSDLLMVALASCTAYDVVDILLKRRAKLTGLRVTVDGQQADQLPHVFTKMHVHYAITGFDLEPADVERAIKLSEEKYCSVSLTLAPTVAISSDYEIIDAAAVE